MEEKENFVVVDVYWWYITYSYKHDMFECPIMEAHPSSIFAFFIIDLSSFFPRSSNLIFYKHDMFECPIMHSPTQLELESGYSFGFWSASIYITQEKLSLWTPVSYVIINMNNKY